MSKERMKVIENILDEVKKHKNDNGEVECYPSYDQEALKLVDDGHVDWLYERVQELEEQLKDRDSAISIGIHVSNLIKKQNKRYREVIQEVKKSLITARKSYSNNKVNQQVYESLKTIQELEESE